MRSGAVMLLGVLLTLPLVAAGAVSASSVTPAVVPWQGDFETGDLSQWSAPQARDRSRITVQSAIRRQGKYAARFEVRPGDNNVAGSGSGERAEVFASARVTNGTEGQEAYWGWSVFFPSDFAAPHGSWNAFTQFHQTGPRGQANIQFDVRDQRRIGLRVMGASLEQPLRKDFTLASLRLDRWYDFVFHVRWSANPSEGFVEVWLDGKRVVKRTPVATLYDGMGVYLKQGYYRRAYDRPTVVYIDGTEMGPTRGSVSEVSLGSARRRLPD